MVLSSEGQRVDLVTSGLNAPVILPKFSHHSAFQLLDRATGKTWWLNDGSNRIGRGFDNDIVITDESVSRRHARITVAGGNIYIEDIGSANGVFVGQERIGKS